MSEDKLNDKLGDIDPDKDFGLPKVEIAPIPTAEFNDKSVEVPQEAVEEEHSHTMPLQPTPDTIAQKKEDETRRSYGWVGLVLIVLAFFFTGWYYFSSQQDRSVETEPEASPVVENIAPVVPDTEPEIVPEEEEVEEFTLTEITSRGDRPRYFVVVGSFVDEDMAKDHSDALNAKGMNTFLIYPYGEIIYYRLAIGQYDTFALALEEINRVKDGYKENLWALKY